MHPISYRVKMAAINELATLHVPVKQHRKKSIKHSPKVKRSEQAAFGVPLDSLLERAGVDVGGLVVPKFFAQIATVIRKEIHTDGLFRVNGNFVRMKKAQEVIDHGGDVQGTVHDVAGLLKQFLRELPEPLLTLTLYPSFVRAQQLTGAHQRSEALLLLCLELPDTHLQVFKFLMHLLYDVVHAPGSRMSASNLAAIFTPNILKPEEEHNATITGELELSNHAVCVSIVEYLIENYSLIGSVPPHVLRRAGEYQSEEKAQSEYLSLFSGHRSWWRNPFSRKKPKFAHLSSAATLDLLKKPLGESNSPAPSTTPSPALDVKPSPVLKRVSSDRKLKLAAPPAAAGETTAPPPDTENNKEEKAPMSGFDSFMMY